MYIYENRDARAPKIVYGGQALQRLATQKLLRRLRQTVVAIESSSDTTIQDKCTRNSTNLQVLNKFCTASVERVSKMLTYQRRECQQNTGK